MALGILPALCNNHCINFWADHQTGRIDSFSLQQLWRALMDSATIGVILAGLALGAAAAAAVAVRLQRERAERRVAPAHVRPSAAENRMRTQRQRR